MSNNPEVARIRKVGREGLAAWQKCIDRALQQKRVGPEDLPALLTHQLVECMQGLVFLVGLENTLPIFTAILQGMGIDMEEENPKTCPN